MAYTYLQVCNKVLTRLNEVSLTSSNFASAVGFQAHVKDAVIDALNDINDAELEWPFNHASSTVTLTADSTTTQSYELAADAATVDWDSFFIQANGTTWSAQPLEFVNYDYWRSTRKETDHNIMAAAAGWGKPRFVFQTQDEALTAGFSPVPDEAYVVEYEYWAKPTDPSAHGDTINLPDRFIKVLYDGMMYYAYMFRDNIELASKAEKKFSKGIERMKTELVNRQQDMQNDMVSHGGRVRQGDPYVF